MPRALLIVLALGVAVAPAAARERLVRHVAAHDPALTGGARAVLRDRAGFVWIGTAGGLARWDGLRVERWAPAQLAQPVVWLAEGPDAALYAAEWDGRLWRVVGRDATLVVGPDGAPITHVDDLRFDGRGRLWLATRDGLLRREVDGTWRRPAGGRIDGARVYRLGRLAGGEIAAVTVAAVYRFVDERPAKVLTMPEVNGVAQTAGGTLWVVQRGAHLHEVTLGADGSAAQIVDRGRWIAIAWDLDLRGEEAYVATSEGLVRAAPGGDVEVLGAEERVPRGTRVFADVEGSVWLATGRGLYQYVFPATATWTERDGVGPAPRFLARAPTGVWASAWGPPLVRFDDRDGVPRLVTEDVITQAPLCVDGTGAVWGGHDGEVFTQAGGGWRRFPLPPGATYDHCAALPDGGVMLAAATALLHTPGGGAPPRAVPNPLTAMRARPAVGPLAVDDRGRLWVASHREVCEAALAAVLAPAPAPSPAWRCVEIEGALDLGRIAPAPSGALWVATLGRGVVAVADGRAAVLGGNADLPNRLVMAIRPARDGMWIGGEGFAVRVRERVDLAAGWEVVEQLGPATGVAALGGGDVLEDPDGTVWLATAQGVARVPAAARSVPPPTALHLVGGAIDGRPVDGRARWRLRADDSHVELVWSALAFRDPGQLWYRMRLGGGWSAPTHDPTLRLIDLPAGSHALEVQASSDGRTWTATARVVEFEVVVAWWRRPWVWAVAAVLAIVAIALAQRARYRLRLRLAEQRMRIAMDLHDEVGSGLSSIGILARVLGSERAPAPAQRGELSARIGDTSRQLGAALADIVAPLRAGGDRLDALIGHVLDRAAALTAEGRPRLVTQVTAPGDATVSLAVRRAVQRVLAEAVHNAVRHADARELRIGLARDGRWWRAWVEDDGRGLDGASPAAGSGLGLASMRRRAAAIGATLTVGPAVDGGTRVELRFRPHADERATG